MSALGAQCPVCKVEHPSICEKFGDAYKAFNDRLSRSVAGIRTPIPPRPPLCECGKVKRPFAPGCAECAPPRPRVRGGK